MIEYMDDELRLGKTDSKGVVHMASCSESENLGDLTQMIIKLTEKQESGQKRMLECLNNMARSEPTNCEKLLQ